MIVLCGLSSCNQKIEKAVLQWITIEEASKIAEGNNKKKFLIDVYTDWCGWCKVMDEKTFTDPQVISYLNENFYVVKFNAEQKETVVYKGKRYEWQDEGRSGYNALSYELLNGRMSYPSLVYMNAKLEPIRISPGYKEPGRLLLELESL
ncbi:MAG: DUF255 domain-containing protein [Chitinophagales bacterium]|nr:DUF255 domain-containing protein [Chitinophagales bacterium]